LCLIGKCSRGNTLCFLYVLIFNVFIPLTNILAQTSFLVNQKDTIKYDSFTGGILDSLDISLSSYSSSLPGGGIGDFLSVQSSDFFCKHVGGVRFYSDINRRKMRFSALPHLGFASIFGNQATQIIHARYTHAFEGNTLLNIDYDKSQGNAFLRASNFSHHDVNLQIEHSAKKYAFRVQTAYRSHLVGHSDGVITDTLLNLYALELIPTRKSDAQSRIQQGKIEMEHFIHFSQDSSLFSTGIYITNTVRTINRKYSETANDLTLIYPTVLLSADSTRDQYQWTELANKLGFFYHRNLLHLQATWQNKKWNFHNLGFFTRKTENNIDFNVDLLEKSFYLKNNTNINLFGAKGEWLTRTNFGFLFGDFSWNTSLALESMLPEAFQRHYHGNNVLYALSFADLKRQNKFEATTSFAYQYAQHRASFFVQHIRLPNNYWFYNNTWTQDTLQNMNTLSVGLKGATNYKSLHMSILGMFNSAKWSPNMLLQTRLFLQGKLFKERKLTGQLGVEASYNTSYYLFEIIPLLDLYRMSNITTLSRMNMHLFGGFELTHFRFFFRFENLAYAWTAHTIQEAIAYPIPSMQLRIGITWDFFN